MTDDVSSQKSRPFRPLQQTHLIETLPPGEHCPYHFHDTKKRKLLSISQNGEFWSAGFFLDVAGLTTIHCGADNYINITVTDTDTSVFVVFQSILPEQTPFLIKNNTSLPLEFFQKDISKTIWRVAPGEKIGYTFDEPTFSPVLLVKYPTATARKPLKFNLNKIKEFKPISCISKDTNVQSFIYPYITVDGACRVFSISDSLVQRATEFEGATISEIKHAEDILPSEELLAEKIHSGKKEDDIISELEKDKLLDFTLDLAGIGLSLINFKVQELLYMRLDRFGLHFSQTAEDFKVHFMLGNFQIDSQLLGTLYPTLLHRTHTDANEKPFFDMSVVKSTHQGMDSFKYLSFLLQEFSLNIDDYLLNKIVEMIQQLPLDVLSTPSSSTPEDNNLYAPPSISLYPYITIPDKLQVEDSRMVYFKILHFNPIKFDITFSPVPGGLLQQFEAHPLVNHLANFGVGTFLNLDQAPIRLNSLLLNDPFCSWNRLIQMLSNHYVRQFVGQIYHILGSVELLGNPVGLFSNIGSGVFDFFYEPAQGLVASPEAFGRGLAKGTTSLVKNSLYGTFNSVSKITGALGKGVASLSMDDEYLGERGVNQRKKPKHVGEGVLQGIQGFGNGVFGGVKGLILKPIQGAKSGGFLGFTKGIGHGIVGVAVKPVVGVLDFAQKTTEGIRNTTGESNNVKRIRAPRTFGIDGEIIAYDEVQATGTFLIETIKSKFQDDKYIFHSYVDDKDTQIFVLTDKNIALLDIRGSTKVLWTIFLDSIIELEIRPTGLFISANTTTHGVRQERLISSGTDNHLADLMLILYTKIGVVIKQHLGDKPIEQTLNGLPRTQSNSRKTLRGLFHKKNKKNKG